VVHKTNKESNLGNPTFKDSGRSDYGIHKYELSNRGDWMGEIEKELEDNEKQIEKYNLEMEKEELERGRREMLREQLEEAEQAKEDLQWEKHDLEAKLETEREKREGMMQPPEPTEPIMPKIKETLSGDIERAREFGLKVGTALAKVPPAVQKGTKTFETFLEGRTKKEEEKKKVLKPIKKGVAG
jgi:chromosome segregation ATPase